MILRLLRCRSHLMVDQMEPIELMGKEKFCRLKITNGNCGQVSPPQKLSSMETT